MCKNPEERLGSKNGILDIVNHPWCRKIKLSDVIYQRIPAPIKPNPYVMYFEKFDPETLEMIKGIINEIILNFSDLVRNSDG